MQVSSCRSMSSARGKPESQLHQGRKGRLRRKKEEMVENRGGVRWEGERLMREAEQLLRRGVEEEEDMNWVRKRMGEVQMSSAEENLGETVKAGGGSSGRIVKASGLESSGGRWEEGRQNSEPIGRVEVEGRGLSRVVRKL